MSLVADNRERTLEVLRIEDLDVDHAYQRALDQRLVERIYRDWDTLAADAITVSLRPNRGQRPRLLPDEEGNLRPTGGKLFIVNGQHRTMAAKLAGEKDILAFVYYDLDRKREADLRLKSNNRRSDTAMERFHGQFVRGDKETLDIVALLKRYDTYVNRTANKHTGVNCVSTIESLFREDKTVFERTLRAVHTAFGAVHGDYASTNILRGVQWFLLVNEGDPRYHWREFLTRMEATGIEEVDRRARSHQSAMRGPLWLNYYRAIVEVYNFHRMEKNRLELRTKYSQSWAAYQNQLRRAA